MPIVPQSELIPKQVESYITRRGPARRPGQRLLHHAGSAVYVPAPGELDGFKKSGLGGIIRMDRDGKNREVYAWGSVTRSAWTQSEGQDALVHRHQVDGMGDDIPPVELNRATRLARISAFPITAAATSAPEAYKNETPRPTVRSFRHGDARHTPPISA